MRSAVMNHLHRDLQSGLAGDEHDAPPVLLFHPANIVPAQAHAGEDVDFEEATPVHDVESDGIPASPAEGTAPSISDRRARLRVFSTVNVQPSAKVSARSSGQFAGGPRMPLRPLLLRSDTMCLLYVGTERRVDRLDPETGHVRHFSSLDGVPSGGFTSAIRDRSGALWFSSRIDRVRHRLA